jgi:hypothetical protein
VFEQKWTAEEAAAVAHRRAGVQSLSEERLGRMSRRLRLRDSYPPTFSTDHPKRSAAETRKEKKKTGV